MDDREELILCVKEGRLPPLSNEYKKEKIMSNEIKDRLEDNKQKPVMSIAECQVETQKHIERVRHYIRFVTDRLTLRGVKHDAIKLESPEVELFAEHTKCLADTAYNSKEYKAHLAALKPALDHHYANSRHHPEHFANGINDMNLIDIVEMLCDWKASSERQKDGNLLKSIEQNANRFNYDDQLKQIFINTAKLFDEHD